MKADSFYIFCDGACSGNPGPGGWGAILISPEGKVLELGGGLPATTNNQMELSAAIEALGKIPTGSSERIDVYTDSSYVINGITKWIFGWKQKAWKSSTGAPVANQPFWERLHAETLRLGAKRIRWNYVPGHQGVVGNERADEIAVAFSTDEEIALYNGTLDGYPHQVIPVFIPLETKTSKKNGTSKGKGFYLSLVDNVLERHETWSACEARVKGRSNAKYKKVTNPAEEKTTLAEWGLLRVE